MTYWGPVAQQAAYLAELTGLNPVVAQAWLMNEGQSDSIATPSNPLNIVVRGGGSGTGTETGRNGPLFTYADWRAGLRAAAALVTRSRHYGGIRAAIATGDAIKQAAAIEASPWAAGGYNSRGTGRAGSLTATTRRLLGLSGPVPSGSTVSQAPQRRVLTSSPITPTPINSSGITGALLAETRELAAVGPVRTAAQTERLAANFDALVRGLGGGSAAVEAVSDYLGAPPLPPAPAALLRPSVAPAVRGMPMLGPSGLPALPPIIPSPAAAPSAAPRLAYDPIGLAVIGALGITLLWLLVGE